jgi:hypothetical protein
MRAAREWLMPGLANLKSSGQPAARQGRSYRAGASRLAGVLTTALLVLAGPVASLWVGVSPAVATSTPVWTQLNPAMSPTARFSAAMADDLATSQLFLFGGSTGGSSLGDTWTWDGSTWTQVSSTGPDARGGASMAYDAANGQLILFGGYDGSYHADTWSWNGSAWILLTPAQSPPGREDASMVYDPAINQLVLFGGFGNSVLLGDTWGWNGSTWTQLASSGPAPRGASSMAYDPAVSQLVLFGGFGSSGDLGDTWVWGGTAWAQVFPALSPAVRHGASMAYDPDTSQLVLFGGTLGGGSRGDSWTWDGTTWTALSPTVSPPARSFAPMADDPATSQLVLFGGSGNTGNLADTWTFAVPATPPAPAPPATTTIRQAGPVTGRTSAAGWAAFTAQLITTGQHGWTRFVTTSKGCGLAVSASGKITTTSRFKGSCTVSGTDSDTGASADSGTWTYTLTMGSVVIFQRGPKAATVTAAASAAFTGHFRTNGGRGRVRYVTTSRACGVIVSTAGAIRTRGRLKPGHCTVSGTDTDPGHARGKWSFTLTIQP